MKVYLGIPTYDGMVSEGTTRSIFKAAQDNPACVAAVRFSGLSLLARNFNTLYAEALNMREDGVTHFCMLHADITVHTQNWLSRMLAIMDRGTGSLLSVVSPIKDSRGLTSTAVDEQVGDDDRSYRVRRLTMHEISERAETFTSNNLLVNTGVLLVDLINFPADEIYFECKDWIIKKNGKYKSVGMSEDWDFSRKARMLGAIIYATREISITHSGSKGYPNQGAWGSLKMETEELV